MVKKEAKGLLSSSSSSSSVEEMLMELDQFGGEDALDEFVDNLYSSIREEPKSMSDDQN
jgi:hypothetical protein